ncbi:CobW family GTP-binding protein [Wielerella bovis]|uniref:CobW family GTP-binding protein n=1 Tax=Wielerella bovis TaxID=2917790 RepID=UPI002018FC87|nr:GTP-binding protein [Wielerella bovis]MCG7656311.1 GTP-binding protein [Wielerella bovis]MCG7658536.1 GTP-binding protein [Wielerella bovis]
MKTKIHLFTGFLGTGKTTTIRSLIEQKPAQEKWLIIVNEFGEIGIDGAVLSDNGIPVSEISGGCLCCSVGDELSDTVRQMLAEHQPQRIIIEASGLAHAAGVIDELQMPDLVEKLDIAATFALVDPRQFVDDDYALNPLYRDQVSACDVLLASKTDLCLPDVLAQFHERAAKLFPPKARVAEVPNAHVPVAWLDTPIVEKSRYRIKRQPENTLGYQSQGYTFAADKQFDVEKMSLFFNELPKLADGLVRAKGVFQVEGSWVWLNWTDGTWGATPVAWRRDNRFELIAKSFDADAIEQKLQDAML